MLIFKESANGTIYLATGQVLIAHDFE
jgi:hypothetical protein